MVSVTHSRCQRTTGPESLKVSPPPGLTPCALESRRPAEPLDVAISQQFALTEMSETAAMKNALLICKHMAVDIEHLRHANGCLCEATAEEAGPNRLHSLNTETDGVGGRKRSSSPLSDRETAASSTDGVFSLDSLPTCEGEGTVFAAVDAEDALEQSVRELLDQICPDNLQTTVDLVAEIVPGDARELKKIIDVIIGKVISDPQSCEMYAKIAYFLKTRYPEFPLEDEEKPATFRILLLMTCQREFEASLAALELSAQETAGLDPQEVSFEQLRRKSRLLAIVKFVAHLCVGNVKFIDLVANELISHQLDPHCRVQEEQKAECVLELIRVVGNKFHRRQDGNVLIHKCIKWLLDRQDFFSMGVRLQIRGLVVLSSHDE